MCDIFCKYDAQHKNYSKCVYVCVKVHMLTNLAFHDVGDVMKARYQLCPQMAIQFLLWSPTYEWTI